MKTAEPGLRAQIEAARDKLAGALGAHRQGERRLAKLHAKLDGMPESGEQIDALDGRGVAQLTARQGQRELIADEIERLESADGSTSVKAILDELPPLIAKATQPHIEAEIAAVVSALGPFCESEAEARRLAVLTSSVNRVSRYASCAWRDLARSAPFDTAKRLLVDLNLLVEGGKPWSESTKPSDERKP